MSSPQELAFRAVGQFPLSVATSLAMERLAGIHPDFSDSSPPIRKYEECWINVKTLFRNLLGSLDTHSAETALPGPLAETLIEEMIAITDIVDRYSNHRCKVVFYISQYKGMDRKYPRAMLRVDTTAKQKLFTSMYNATIDAIKQLQPNLRIEEFELKLKPQHRTKAILLSHIPYDLISHREFSSLTLIESHTGTIKEEPQWYTKFHSGKDLPMIPFREDMLQVFGDGEHFKPFPIKARRDVTDIALKYGWSSITTSMKIRYGIEQLLDPYERQLLLSMLV